MQGPSSIQIPGAVYASFSGGGLWKSSNFFDASPQWTSLTSAIGDVAGQVALGFNKVPSIYYATGDPFEYSSLSGNFYTSKNGGLNWSTPILLLLGTTMWRAL